MVRPEPFSRPYKKPFITLGGYIPMIEYLFKTLPEDDRKATDELNVLARQGWRVVHAQVDRHMLWYLLLERDLEEADND